MQRNVIAAVAALAALGMAMSAGPALAQFPLDDGPGFFFSGDWLNWRARRADMDFVIVDPVADGSVVGDQKAIDYDLDNGFRVGGGLRLASGWDVWGTYTYFHASDGDTYLVPDAGAQLWGTRIHPSAAISGGFSTGNVAFAEATSSLNLQVADIGLGRSVNGTAASARLFGGFRYAQIDQHFQVTYSDLDGFDVNVSNPHKIDAYGIRGGGEVHANLPLGFSVFGWGGASLLVGHVRSNWTQTSSNPNLGIVDVNSNYIQTIPVLEAGAGVAWIAGPADIRVGYEFANWFNVNERVDYNDDIGLPKHSRGFSDLLLDGLFVRLGFSI